MRPSLQHIFLSCKKASELIDKKESVGISIKENIQLKMHEYACRACAEYHKQSLQIDKMLSKYTNMKKGDLPKIDKVDLENKIKSKL